MLTATAYNVLKIILALYLLAATLMILRYNRSYKKANRISAYTLKSSDVSTNVTFGDACIIILNKLVKGLSKKLIKFKTLNNFTKRQEKYLPTFNNPKLRVIDFVSYKIIIFILIVVVMFTYKILTNVVINGYDIILALFFSYFSVELYLKYRFYLHNRRIKEQLLDAIILMNNAFKAGKSTLLALENVYLELDNELGHEFRIVYNDITKGLGIDEAFNRLALRTDLREIDYIASSVCVMTKAGGNIVKVFERILTSYYNRKKLEAEASAVLIVSKITMWVLILMPLVFGLIITLINQTYFQPLFTTDIGNIVFGVIVFLYFIYIFITTKIIKGVEVW